jgi:transcriptional regulator with XRE-family HTH domain
MYVMDTVIEAISALGARIAALRKGKRMRQEDVAAAAGVARATVREIEHGSITAEIGSYFRVLEVLDALNDVNLVVQLPAHPADGAARPVMRVRPPRPVALVRRIDRAGDKDVVHLDDYPQLAQIGWSRAVRETTGEDALALYEANWRFVEQDKLTAREKALLERLVKKYGHGVLNV